MEDHGVIYGDFVTLKTGKDEEVAAATGRLLRQAAQIVESRKKIPEKIEIIRKPLSVGYKMYLSKKAQE